MNIKVKLTLGVGFLFSMIVILAAVSAWYIHALKNDTTNILTANYNTLEYSRSMLMALEEIPTNPDAESNFEESLKKQQYNITEIGEKEITDKITGHFNKLKAHINDSLLKNAIRADITEVMRLNMQAIQRKSQVAVATSETATFWIAVSGTLCFLLAFILLINLPSAIANPIQELNESIKDIAGQNYSRRVHFKGSSEFEELAGSFNKMAEKLEEYNNSNLSQLLIEKKRIDTLINNMNDPVIGLDEDQKIIFANHEALKILDAKQHEVIGHQASKLALTNDLLRSLLKETLSPSTDKKEPVKIYSNGKESYFQKEMVDISIIPTGELIASTIGKVIILRNITHFKELDSAKTNFIATVSHELKTPISSIKMSLQLLENKNTGAINSGQEQLIESIKEDSNRLLKITSELLNLSQIETGNIQLNLHKANPLEVVNYAIQAVQTQAQQKQIVIEIIHGDTLSEMRADAEKTTWVLINFLTNAIRYSPEQSKVKIAIKQEENTISISVIDEGKGIDERYKNRIFDRYFQIPGSSKTGTGLGLAISKEFIEAQGGEIGLTSGMGMGSTFYFKLPAY